MRARRGEKVLGGKPYPRVAWGKKCHRRSRKGGKPGRGWKENQQKRGTVIGKNHVSSGRDRFRGLRGLAVPQTKKEKANCQKRLKKTGGKKTSNTKKGRGKKLSAQDRGTKQAKGSQKPPHREKRGDRSGRREKNIQKRRLFLASHSVGQIGKKDSRLSKTGTVGGLLVVEGHEKPSTTREKLKTLKTRNKIKVSNYGHRGKTKPSLTKSDRLCEG